MGNCSLVLTLVVTEATGTTGQNGARAFNSLGGVAGVAELHIDYEPPTTHEQLEWAADTSCEVAVSVPTAFTANPNPNPNPNQVAVSGGTLVLCFLGMLLMPVHTIQTMGLAAAITVVYAAPQVERAVMLPQPARLASWGRLSPSSPGPPGRRDALEKSRQAHAA